MITAARADGSWALLDEVDDLVVPDDLAGAFAALAGAAGGFEAFPASIKKAYLWWLVSAKQPETRSRRATEVAERSVRGLRPDQMLD